MTWILTALIASYFLGSMPTAYLLTHFFLKKDLRTIGSGNIGATNAFRTGHKWIGIVTFLGDIGKSILAISLTLWIFDNSPLQAIMALASLLLVLVGHIFPIWLKLKGGKGVAPFLGGSFVLFPVITLGCLAIWGLIFASSRISSLSSLGALCFSPLLLWFFKPDIVFSSPFFYQKLGIFFLCCGLILLKHTSNIRRLFRKEELSFSPESHDQKPLSEKKPKY